VLKEEIITDLYEFLTILDKNKLMRICYFPEKINGIPQDDQDLVDRAIIKYRMYGESIMKVVMEHHPQLFERVKAGIDAGLFKEYGI
jgi:hypothetical protein